MVDIDCEAIVDALRAALPDATPNAAALMFLAQVPYLDAAKAERIVDAMGRDFPPGAWYFNDDRLDEWPDQAAAAAMRHVRRLEPGWRRVLLLCELTDRLTEEERLEALEGIRDGSLDRGTVIYGKCDYRWRDDADRLVRSLPMERQAAWIRAGSEGQSARDALYWEVRARFRLQAMPESVARDLFARFVELWESDPRWCDLPKELVDRLPPDLQKVMLERARALPLQRGWRLRAEVGDLSDAEYREVMRPPEELTRLSFVPFRHGFPHAPYDVLLRWLEGTLALRDFDRQSGLVELLPHLREADRLRAEEALAVSIVRDGVALHGSWHVVPEVELAPLVWRLRDDPYGWHRDALIEHILAERSTDCAERCLAPLLTVLSTLPADHRLEIVTAMTPWLAAQTREALPAALADLPIRASEIPEYKGYTMMRGYERDCAAAAATQEQ